MRFNGNLFPAFSSHQVRDAICEPQPTRDDNAGRPSIVSDLRNANSNCCSCNDCNCDCHSVESQDDMDMVRVSIFNKLLLTLALLFNT